MTIQLSSIFRVKDVGFEVVAGGGLQWDTTTESVTAKNNEGYLCDTTAGSFTITLPDGPAVGDQVGIKDVGNTFDTNPLTIDPNGFLIEGSSANKIVTDEKFYTVMVYSGASRGWLYTDVRSHYGVGNFAGSGAEVTIPHGFAVIPDNVTVNAVTNPGGYLGETWVRKDATNIYVGNSGAHTGQFNWSASV